jgi:16S rRNA (guanine527-N7)-methyltransferase
VTERSKQTASGGPSPVPGGDRPVSLIDRSPHAQPDPLSATDQGLTSAPSTASSAPGPRPHLAATPPEATGVFGDYCGVAERYVSLLADTGISHGLIGPREGPRLWDRHVLNCGVVSPLLAEGSSVADLGSGAGLPGLVFALMRPDVTMHLVEPLHRRIVWLERAIAELGLDNVTLHEARAEALAGAVDVDYVTARAVARLDKLGRWAVPLLPRGGQMLALKGESAAQELAEDLPKLQRALPGRVQSAEVVRCGEGEIAQATLVVRLVVTPAAAATPRGRAKGRSGRSARQVDTRDTGQDLRDVSP